MAVTGTHKAGGALRWDATRESATPGDTHTTWNPKSMPWPLLTTWMSGAEAWRGDVGMEFNALIEPKPL